eukprot:COSAG01_NODE_19_length_39011_cov_38.134968_17_plen_87_part_00
MVGVAAGAMLLLLARGGTPPAAAVDPPQQPTSLQLSPTGASWNLTHSGRLWFASPALAPLRTFAGGRWHYAGDVRGGGREGGTCAL